MTRMVGLSALLAGVVCAALVACSATASQESERDPAKLAPDMYEIVLENAHVRVLKVTSRPGETPPVHSHPDRVLVSVNGCVDNVADEKFDVGEVSWLPAVTHGGQKVTSEDDCIFMEIELKENTAPPDRVPDDVVPAWPRAGAKKVLENERVVVWDYTFSADLEVPVHYHDKDHVHVSLAPGRIRRIPQDGGDPILSDRKAGNVAFVPRGALHREEYVDGGLRVVVIQLLGG